MCQRILKVYLLTYLLIPASIKLDLSIELSRFYGRELTACGRTNVRMIISIFRPMQLADMHLIRWDHESVRCLKSVVLNTVRCAAGDNRL